MEERPIGGRAETMNASSKEMENPPAWQAVAVKSEPVEGECVRAVHPNGIKCEDEDRYDTLSGGFSAQVKQEGVSGSVDFVAKEESMDDCHVVMRGDDFVVTVDPYYMEPDEEMVTDYTGHLDSSVCVMDRQRIFPSSASDFLPGSGGDAHYIRIKDENVEIKSSHSMSSACQENGSDPQSQVGSSSLVAVQAAHPLDPLGTDLTADKSDLSPELTASEYQISSQFHDVISGEKFPRVQLPDGCSVANCSSSGQFSRSLASDETGLSCPTCGKQCSSQRMLICHVRAAHLRQEKSQNFPSILRCLIKSGRENSSGASLLRRCPPMKACSTSQSSSGLAREKPPGAQLVTEHGAGKPHSQAELSKETTVEETGKADEFKCSDCGKQFSEPNELLCHVDLVHVHRGPEKDEDCTYGKSHLFQSCRKRPAPAEQEDPHEHQCSFCPKRYASSSALHIHTQEVHKPEKMYRCRACGKTSYRKSGIVRHVRTIHQNLLKKNILTLVRGSSKEMEKDMETLQHEEKDRSTQCGNNPAQEGSCETEASENTQPSTYCCPECRKTFPHKGTFELHIKVAHRVNYFEMVHITEKETSTESEDKLRTSTFPEKPGVIAARSNGSSEKWFPVRSEYDLFEVITVEPEIRDFKLYECDECNRKYLQKGALHLHMMMVHERRRHSVSTCEQEDGAVENTCRSVPYAFI